MEDYEIVDQQERYIEDLRLTAYLPDHLSSKSRTRQSGRLLAKGLSVDANGLTPPAALDRVSPDRYILPRYHLGRVFAAAQDERQLPGMLLCSICRGRPAAMGRSLHYAVGLGLLIFLSSGLATSELGVGPNAVKFIVVKSDAALSFSSSMKYVNASCKFVPLEPGK